VVDFDTQHELVWSTKQDKM